jgi:hypothetical protein
MVSALPDTNFSQLDWRVLGEPSIVLCGTVCGMAVIDSSNDVVSGNYFDDAKCGSCNAFPDANSAAPATNFSQLKMVKLDDPVLCDTVPELAVITTSDDPIDEADC